MFPIVRREINTFSVSYEQTLAEDGTADHELMPHISEDVIKEMYHLMVLARAFDDKLFTLQRSGRIGTYAQVKGQEAAQVGSAMALEQDDWMIPSFREMTVSMVRGADRAKLVQGWRGDLRAFEADPETARDLPVNIPIASQTLLAAGIAWAEKLKKSGRAAIVYFGDGATSEGDFHEALNFAGVYDLPVVFFCQNNQWAISTPRTQQTRSESIAQKAIAYGIEGVQVDGNDAVGVYRRTKMALEKARRGEGPTLIEALTYRRGDHTTSDDASKYRTDENSHSWDEKDPILRLERYFQTIGTWSDEYGERVAQTSAKEVEEAVEAGLAIEPPGPENIFEHIFNEMPKHYEEQLDFLKTELEARGDER